ncbi:MAG: HYC_CC_PP family protein [Flavobacteriales bacterium]
MIRKSVIILLVLLYFAGNSYAHVDMHFCCGHLVDWSLFGNAEDCGGSDCQKKDCCNDVSIMIENADEHTTPLAQAIDFNCLYSPLVAEIPQEKRFYSGAEALVPIPFSNAPPNVAHRSIFLLCEVFRL